MLSHEFGREKGIQSSVHCDDVGAVGIGRVWIEAVDCVSWVSSNLVYILQYYGNDCGWHLNHASILASYRVEFVLAI